MTQIIAGTASFIFTATGVVTFPILEKLIVRSVNLCENLRDKPISIIAINGLTSIPLYALAFYMPRRYEQKITIFVEKCEGATNLIIYYSLFSLSLLFWATEQTFQNIENSANANESRTLL